MSWQAPSRSPRAPRRLSWPADLLLAAVLGIAHSRSFAYSGAWWVELAALALFASRVISAGRERDAGRAAGQAAKRGDGRWRATGLGLVFGTAWLSASTWWMYISLHDYGGLPAWMAALAVGLLCALLSLYLAAAMALFVVRRRGRPLGDALLFASTWLLAELARGVIFTGFPWAASGYAHTSGPLAPLAPWVGVYGIGFVAALIAALVAACLAGERRPIAWAWTGVALVAMGASALLGAPSFGRPTSTLSLTLLQTNVPQDEKFAAEYLPEELEWLNKQLMAAKGSLVVAPETAIPLLPDQLSPEYWEPILRHFQEVGKAALIGLPLGNADIGYTNSVAGISSASQSEPIGFYRYDKHHLVPFGEFIPDGFHWFVAMMNIPLGDFNRGGLDEPSFPVGDERVAPNICYEDLFGEELGVRFADATRAPTLFVNISNIAWFGDTVALHQHEEISRMRTLEFQRPMVRSTNTGMTVVIDHRGVTRASLAPYTRAALETEVQGRDGLTPFAAWVSKANLWPLLVLALIIVGWPRKARDASA